jgi:aspartate racemase
MRRLALFGTRYTMQADFYQRVFAREGIELVVPAPKDQDYIHEKYFAELVPGIFLPETRAGLLTIIDRMKANIDIDGITLAGTELALILRGESHNGVALLDTGKIHCQAAVDEMLK